MPRLAGIDIPDNKRTQIALTYIYGIGKYRSTQILKQANIDPDKRASKLSPDEVSKLQRIIERYNVEGNLRKQIRENIERLKRIGSYRGMRHHDGLPTRGQRTRVNARTRRGKRKTVGAMKKADLAKTEATQ